jgi:hypothetical protein
MPETIQWEYRVLTLGSFLKGVKDDEFENILNQLGEESWEVVGLRTIENSNQAQIVAKRPLTRESRRWRSMP